MNQDIETLELSIIEAQKYIGKMNSLLALTKNKDFQIVIEKGYFEEEASRLVLLKADPSMQSESDQNMINKSIDSIGYFRQHLRTIIHMGRMMERSLEEDQVTRDELLMDEAN